MNKKISFLLGCYLLLLTSILYAQKSAVDVNLSTGSANVVIPIYTINRGSVTFPISLVYSSSGIKPRDVEGSAGMGWQLSAGGAVTRVVRGLPDDVMQDNASTHNSRLGWMYNSKQSTINAFGISNDNNPATCPDATTDLGYISSNLSDLSDTEPDIFYVNAPGLSCELVWDQSTGKFNPTNYQDIKITYSANGTGVANPGEIRYFVITNDKGVKYTFNAPDQITDRALGTSPVYFKTKYSQYQYGITYYSNWRLSSVFDANGNGVIITYSAGTQRSSSDPLNLYMPGNTTTTLQYNFSETVSPQVLSSIQEVYGDNTVNSFSLSWNNTGSGGTGINYIGSISGFGHAFSFQYDRIIYMPTGYPAYYREFLRTFSDPGNCSSPVNYSFAYIGVNTSVMSTTLPDSTSAKQDYWGYYNAGSGTSLMPKMLINASTTSAPQYSIYDSQNVSYYPYYTTNGNIRSADTVNVMAASLNKINYAEGGNTTLVYQSNDYLDNVSGAVIKGGGVRVRQIIDSVSTTSTNNIIRNYLYTDPATGLSSGKPVTLPVLAFNIPYGGSASGNTLYNNATVVSDYDLSGEDHSIVYKFVRVSQPGIGYTKYQYYLPATNWDVSAIPGCSGCATADWSPTINYIQPITCGSVIAPILNNIDGYPFTPNTNYDFERGLLQKVSSYNSSGYEVSEENYTYQRAFSPAVIPAFRTEDIPYASGGAAVKSYAKYNVYYNTGEMSYTINKKIFDSNNQNTSASSTTTYTYGSANHKLPTAQSTTNSDNSTVTTNFSYVKDYQAASGSNANVTAIYNLQQQNINAPVESYQQVTRNGTTLVTGGSLNLFSAFTAGTTTHYLPAQQLRFIQPDGIATTSFSPYAVSGSGQTSTYDTRYYLPVANYDLYDNTGYAVMADDNYQHFQTTVFDPLTNQFTASFKNAKYNEVAFSDFDTRPATPVSGFTITGAGSYTPVGSHAGNAAGMLSSQTATSAALVKNPFATKFIFSIWINPSANGTLTVLLNGVSITPTISYTTGGWKYYELQVLAGSVPANPTVSFTSTQNISIDDVLFYPEVASVTTATYDATTHNKTAVTNTNGVSSYFTYDQWGRMLYAYDQDKNIVQKNTYLTPADIKSYVPTISCCTSATVGTAVGFNVFVPNACASAGATVAWNFGDGTSQTAALGVSVSHTYTTSGTKSVTATVNSPIFGATNLAMNVTVSPGSVQLTYSNYTTGNGNIDHVYFFDSTNTNLLYTFTGAQLNGATVLQGNYAIRVSLSGGTLYNSGTGLGYSCVYLNGTCTTDCKNYVSSNSYVFYDNLAGCTSYDFTVSQYTCSHFAIP